MAREEISASWAGQVIDWMKMLPARLRAGTETVLGIEKILIGPAASGASLEDLAAIPARALAPRRAGLPDRHRRAGRGLRRDDRPGGDRARRRDRHRPCPGRL
jgi:hypothetical protein